jgi:hypothetical protein
MIGVLIGVGCLVAGVAIVSWACVYNAQLVEADVDYARSLEAPEAWEQEPVALWPATPGWCEEHGDEMDLASVCDEHADPNAHAAQGCAECAHRLIDLALFAAAAVEVEQLEAAWALPAAGGRP